MISRIFKAQNDGISLHVRVFILCNDMWWQRRTVPMTFHAVTFPVMQDKQASKQAVQCQESQTAVCGNLHGKAKIQTRYAQHKQPARNWRQKFNTMFCWNLIFLNPFFHDHGYNRT